MKLKRYTTCCIVLMLIHASLNAQLYKIDLAGKINKARFIVEATVTEQHSFWNEKHTLIYTSSTLHIYKLFKGDTTAREIEVITQGGSVGNTCLKVSDMLQLKPNQTGMFFLAENSLKLHSPVTKKALYDVYSSAQGFLRYNKLRTAAQAPFANYENIEQTLYNLIRQHTGVQERIMDRLPVVSAAGASSGNVDYGTAGSAIISFSPTTVHAGALNDAANNLLTINGSGFGNNPSGSAGVSFKDANSDNTDPDYTIAYSSPYILSWSDSKITLNVPDQAATGKFAVILNDGSTVLSAADLDVFFAVQNAEFTGYNIVREPRLMNTNNSGGYTVQYSTSTAGKGKDFNASTAKPTFQRAMATWKEIAGANFTEGATTTVQVVDDDDINVVMFDNNNTGVDPMADGVLEATYSWYSACPQGTNGIYTAQKTGFDILIRNEAVSTGADIDFEDGPCFPATGSYDLEMIFLHELGHALNLAHINDDLENGNGGYPTVNPSKLMHYSVLDYVDRRSPDVAAYQGALYTITPQKNNYGNCTGGFTKEMVPLTATVATNDNCPATFPAEELQDNTTVNFDLTHATSSKFVDPSFKQINCTGTGTSVTNNAYYAFYTGQKTDITVNIKDYTTTPANLASCSGQSLRMALYDVSTCPEGQSFPAPVVCATFSKNTTLNLTNLQQNHKYLLYFDGVRNTKASFNAVFNPDGSSGGTSTTVGLFPNPIAGTTLNLVINNPSGGASYEYALFDAVGKKLLTGKITTTQAVQTYTINMFNVAAGIYFLRLVDENGKTIEKKKILKMNQ